MNGYASRITAGSAVSSVRASESFTAAAALAAKTLGQHSGGEKAMTAIALLVSVFQVRPSPFFLLDEVDAALDDANVGRFNEIVYDLAEASQFLLITHNKRTIEVADILYGVTMEEKGVSKLVAVELH